MAALGLLLPEWLTEEDKRPACHRRPGVPPGLTTWKVILLTTMPATPGSVNLLSTNASCYSLYAGD